MKSTSYSLPAGFEDFDAPGSRLMSQIEQTLLETFGQYGYRKITVPTLEYSDLYNPNRIGHELFHQLFITRNARSDRFPAEDADPTEQDGEELLAEERFDLALRPELTAPLARWFVNRVIESDKPLYHPQRFAYFGQVFRNIEPSPLKLKEFRQAGVELTGSNNQWADLEVLLLAIDCLKALKLPRWKVNIGHAQLYRNILDAHGLSELQAAVVAKGIDVLERIHQKTADDDQTFLNYARGFIRDFQTRLPGDHTFPGQIGLESAGEWREALPRLYENHLSTLWADQLKVPAAEVEKLLELARISGPRELFFEKISAFKMSPTARQYIAELEWIGDYLEKEESLAVDLRPAASRGLAYYTGLTFEIHSPIHGSPYSDICGGGRYDELHSWIYHRALQTQEIRSGKTAAPIRNPRNFLTGVGFAFVMERLAAVMAPLQGREQKATGIFVALRDAGLSEEAFRLARRLRRQGQRVKCHLPTTDSEVEIEEQLGHARRIGARYALIMEREAWQEQKIGFLDLTGSEGRNLPLSEVEILLREEA